jgi:hypothetical protein
MFWHKKLNEIIATDTYFASKKTIEAFYCPQVFFCMISEVLHVVGMKTASELSDVNSVVK